MLDCHWDKVLKDSRHSMFAHNWKVHLFLLLEWDAFILEWLVRSWMGSVQTCRRIWRNWPIGWSTRLNQKVTGSSLNSYRVSKLCSALPLKWYSLTFFGVDFKLLVLGIPCLICAVGISPLTCLFQLNQMLAINSHLCSNLHLWKTCHISFSSRCRITHDSDVSTVLYT